MITLQNVAINFVTPDFAKLVKIKIKYYLNIITIYFEYGANNLLYNTS